MGIFNLLFSTNKNTNKRPKNHIKSETIEGVNFRFLKHHFSKCIKMSVRNNDNTVLVTFPKYVSYKLAKEYAHNNVEWAKKSLKNTKKCTDDAIIDIRRKLAKDYLPKRIYELSQKYGFKYNDLRLKNMKTRWGSCSYRNNINLNINLMALDYELIDYVLLHELAHTVHKNHGSEFWNCVRTCMPDADKKRACLKKYSCI